MLILQNLSIEESASIPVLHSPLPVTSRDGRAQEMVRTFRTGTFQSTSGLEGVDGRPTLTTCNDFHSGN